MFWCTRFFSKELFIQGIKITGSWCICWLGGQLVVCTVIVVISEAAEAGSHWEPRQQQHSPGQTSCSASASRHTCSSSVLAWFLDPSHSFITLSDAFSPSPVSTICTVLGSFFVLATHKDTGKDYFHLSSEPQTPSTVFLVLFFILLFLLLFLFCFKLGS